MRDTGPVRKELSGEEAAPYIGFARTALGQLKNDMQFGGLRQGKMTRQLSDGTTITVTSVFGEDKISITKPAPVAEEKPVETFEPTSESASPIVPEAALRYDDTSTRSVFLAGTCAQQDAPYDTRAFWWHGGQTVPIVTPGDSYALGISGNGMVVVGSYSPQANEEHAFRWTAATGYEDLGTVPNATGRLHVMATGANHDGSVIVGVADGGEFGASCHWVWTRQTGIVELPGSFWTDVNAAGQKFWTEPKISPNGRYVVGTGIWYPVTYYVQAHPAAPQTIERTNAHEPTGRFWRLTNGKPDAGTELPGTGTYYETRLFTGDPADFVYSTEYKSFPTDVSDTGVVCGYGGTIGGFVYHTDKGNYTPLGLALAPRASTNDGGRMCGNVDTTTAGVYTVRSGSQVLVGDAQFYDISGDGIQYAGGRGAMFQPYHHEQMASEPVLWTGGGAQPVRLLPGTARGFVKCISAPRLSVSSDPQVSPSTAV